jgi:hypothetical protein
MIKIGDAFFNMNHVFMVYPTTAMKKPFDVNSNKNYKPTATVVSAIDGKDTVVNVGDEFIDKESALALAKEYVSKIKFTSCHLTNIHS